MSDFPKKKTLKGLFSDLSSIKLEINTQNIFIWLDIKK